MTRNSPLRVMEIHFGKKTLEEKKAELLQVLSFYRSYEVAGVLCAPGYDPIDDFADDNLRIATHVRLTLKPKQ